ncbi:unnamed protein product, partial [Prorocentrum cordatum]
ASVACPINCHCDYGMSGILLGIFVILAAGVFTFFPVFLNWFAWEWYIDLCWLWFCLGVVILTFACVYECCVGAPDAKARKPEADVEDGAVNASVACPINCHCDYGMSGILLGIFVILAAGVFTFLPVFLNWFAWEWYIDLCWLWFCLGVVILTFACVYECCVGAPDAKARKPEADVEDGAVNALALYIMINN